MINVILIIMIINFSGVFLKHLLLNFVNTLTNGEWRCLRSVVIVTVILLVPLLIQKTFETMNISILLTKLDNYWISCNLFRWFENYLGYRSEYVDVNNLLSRKKNNKSRLSQGSILRPHFSYFLWRILIVFQLVN